MAFNDPDSRPLFIATDNYNCNWYSCHTRDGGLSWRKLTLVFAVLLIALGLAGYLGTGNAHPTALIPTWIGLALGSWRLFGDQPQ